jgi:hypothetical protein
MRCCILCQLMAIGQSSELDLYYCTRLTDIRHCQVYLLSHYSCGVILLTAEQSLFFDRDGRDRTFSVIGYSFYFILLTLAVKMLHFPFFIQFHCYSSPLRSHFLELHSSMCDSKFLPAVTTKTGMFWDMMLGIVTEIYQHVEEPAGLAFRME